MIQFVRKYACVVVLILMSAFATCLIADEWSDMLYALQDMQIETTAEIEVEDFEWDEFGGDNGTGITTTSRIYASSFSHPFWEGLGSGSFPFISDKQRLGLVRRYALRKVVLRHYYDRT